MPRNGVGRRVNGAVVYTPFWDALQEFCGASYSSRIWGGAVTQLTSP